MKTLLFALLCAVSLPATAANFDYSFVEGGFTQNKLDGIDGTNGYALTASLGLGEHFLVDLSDERADFETHIYLGSVSMSRVTAHVGFPVALMDDVDLVFRLGDSRITSTSTGTRYTLSDSAIDARASVRARLPARFELEAGFGYGPSFVYTPANHVFAAYVGPGGGTENFEFLALRYGITDHFLLGLSYDSRSSGTDNPGSDSHMRIWTLAARWAF